MVCGFVFISIDDVVCCFGFIKGCIYYFFVFKVDFFYVVVEVGMQFNYVVINVSLKSDVFVIECLCDMVFVYCLLMIEIQVFQYFVWQGVEIYLCGLMMFEQWECLNVLIDLCYRYLEFFCVVMEEVDDDGVICCDDFGIVWQFMFMMLNLLIFWYKLCFGEILEDCRKIVC